MPVYGVEGTVSAGLLGGLRLQDVYSMEGRSGPMTSAPRHER